jgi:transposase
VEPAPEAPAGRDAWQPDRRAGTAHPSAADDGLEIEETPDFLRLYKLAGLNLVTTYALVAVIGDITRFAHSKNLVSYLGLNPSVVQSGESKGSGALHGHGRGSLRALLIQASKRLLTTVNPLQKWGLAVALRRGLNKAAVAVRGSSP